MNQYLDYPVIGDPSPEAVEFGRIVLGNGVKAGKLRYGGERHMLVIGGNGSGKGTRILMPNLLNMGGSRSIVVVDPAGELAAVTAPWRRQVGDVVILNPFGVLTDYRGYEDLAGVGFNPLAALDPTSYSFNTDASLLAEAMIFVSDKGESKHFDESARALVAATIMFVVIVGRESGVVPTMKHVRQLICMASGEARPPSIFNPKGTEEYGIPKMAAQMMRSSIAGLRNKAAQFTDWNREIQSVASTAKIQTECFDDWEIAESLGRNDFDFAGIKRRPTTVYLVLPPEMMGRHSKWLRLILTTALQASLRTRFAGEPSILFMLDEFAALGHLKIIEETWAQVRKYGIQMMPVIQDLSQLKSLYGDRWESFAANAGVITAFAPNEPTTAEWLSKRMGQTTVMMTATSTNLSRNRGTNRGRTDNPGGGGTSEGQSDGESWSKTSNATPIKVPFLSPDKLYGMRPGYMVVISAGLSNAAPSFAHAYYKITTRLNRARANPYVHDVPRNPNARRRGMGEPTWEWGQPPQQPSGAGWGGAGQNVWANVRPSGNGGSGGGSSPSPAPSGSGWQSRPEARPPMREAITGRAQARHPGYAPEPPPDDDRGGSDGGDGWE